MSGLRPGDGADTKAAVSYLHRVRHTHFSSFLLIVFDVQILYGHGYGCPLSDFWLITAHLWTHVMLHRLIVCDSRWDMGVANVRL